MVWEQWRCFMACGLEVFMEVVFSEQNIYYSVSHGKLNVIFFVSLWQFNFLCISMTISGKSFTERLFFFDKNPLDTVNM